MRRVVFVLLAVLTSFPLPAQSQTQTVTGSFQLSDPTNIFGQGTQASVDPSGSFLTTAALSPTGGINQVQFNASPADGSVIWSVAFTNTQQAFAPGTYTVDGTTVTTDVGATVGGATSVCGGGTGTLIISRLTQNSTATTSPDIVTGLQGTFQIDCFNADGSLSGNFSYDVTSSGGGGGGGGTGGGGGGTGGGTIPVPSFPPILQPGGSVPTPSVPAAPQLFVTLPPSTVIRPVEFGPGETQQIAVSAQGNATFNAPVTISATSEEGLTFSSSVIPAPGTGTTALSVTVAPLALPRDYHVTVLASGGGIAAATSFTVRVLCNPPQILGIQQPRSVTVSTSDSARLQVSPIGSGPFQYQWYAGHSGFTRILVDGATGAALTLPPTAITGINEYWVRISNACGSVDSTTASVTVTP